MLNRNAMIESLKSNFNLSSKPAEDFYADDTIDTGLWINDDICKPETDYYNYADGTLENNKLNDFLKKNGWFAEPYDGETIMIWPIYVPHRPVPLGILNTKI